MKKSLIRSAVKIALSLLVFSSLALAGEESNAAQAPPILILPFVVLLVAIALGPFINRHWWEKNYSYVAAGLGLITVAYYLFVLGDGARMLQTGREYISFIVLIGSLFVVSGGIHLRILGKATPIANVSLLAVGAVVANFVGTTGASMILIRPFLRANKYRLRSFHVVFFIFVVSNIGGALTPVGDPPLFLGYLKGVPFFWVLASVWHIWLLGIGMVLAFFLSSIISASGSSKRAKSIFRSLNCMKAPRSVECITYSFWPSYSWQCLWNIRSSSASFS